MAENKAGLEILKMLVTDGDQPHSVAWNAKFTIVSGDPEGFFSVKTGTNKQEGILSIVEVHFFNEFGTVTSWLRKLKQVVAALFVLFPRRVLILKRAASTPC